MDLHLKQSNTAELQCATKMGSEEHPTVQEMILEDAKVLNCTSTVKSQYASSNLDLSQYSLLDRSQGSTMLQ